MQRRDFLKISAVTGAATALDGCGHPDRQLIRFIPDEDLVPGQDVWKPSLCTLCPAGCGLMVRVMEGEAEVVREGLRGLVKMGLAKKLEGNPNHPVNRGKLCPRGQAGLQVTYHPDRIRNPLRRSGPRGSGQFREVSWDDALKELVSQLSQLRAAGANVSLAFMARPLRGERRRLIEQFLKDFGAPPAVTVEFFDQAVLRQANDLSFGRSQLPTLDLARCNYLVSFGADFLGTWNSPVAHSIAYGEMRQGRPGQRAKFVQVEPRMSLTGASADEWIPARPGTEGTLALGLAHVIMAEKLRPAQGAGRAGELVAEWSEGLPGFSPESVEKKTGVAAATVRRLGREMAAHEPALAVIGGAPLANANALGVALAVNALNALLGSVEKLGGIFFTPQPTLTAAENRSGIATPVGAGATINRFAKRAVGDPLQSEVWRPTVSRAVSSAPIKLLLLYEANPVYAMPGDFKKVLEKIPFIASFGSFIDETSGLADLILPDHSFLESWLDDVPESGSDCAVVSLAAPAMRPLHNTRAMPDVLLEVAHRIGGEIAASLPWKDFESMLRDCYTSLRARPGSIGANDGDSFWKKIQEQGVWHSNGPEPLTSRKSPLPHAPISLSEPEFNGEGKSYPFYFFPFPSQMLMDGSLAHLPWLQETPDPLTTSMWGSWVEINPKTAERLGVQQGDLVEVNSQAGGIQVAALLSPGVAPEVVAMPVGQGHENFGRYASRRGANPISILVPQQEPNTGSLAWAATRVKLTRVGEGKLTLFAGGLRERPREEERR